MPCIFYFLFGSSCSSLLGRRFDGGYYKDFVLGSLVCCFLFVMLDNRIVQLP